MQRLSENTGKLTTFWYSHNIRHDSPYTPSFVTIEYVVLLSYNASMSLTFPVTKMLHILHAKRPQRELYSADLQQLGILWRMWSIYNHIPCRGRFALIIQLSLQLLINRPLSSRTADGVLQRYSYLLITNFFYFFFGFLLNFHCSLIMK